MHLVLTYVWWWRREESAPIWVNTVRCIDYGSAGRERGRWLQRIFCVCVRTTVAGTSQSQLVRRRGENAAKKGRQIKINFSLRNPICVSSFSRLLHSSPVVFVPNIDPRHHRCHRYRRRKITKLVLVQMFLFLAIVRTGNQQINNSAARSSTNRRHRDLLEKNPLLTHQFCRKNQIFYGLAEPPTASSATLPLI